jgi:hypothetical protein
LRVDPARRFRSRRSTQSAHTDVIRNFAAFGGTTPMGRCWLDTGDALSFVKDRETTGEDFMINDLKAMAVAALGTVVLTATPLLAQDMGEWDADGDGLVNQEEFTTGWNDVGTYGEWDADGDGSLTEDEFNAGVFDGYDADDSGGIEEPEFGDVGDDIGDGGLFDI